MATSRVKKTAKSRSNFRASWKGQLRFGLVSFEVKAVIAAKKRGVNLQPPKEDDEPEVINLMDALKQSIAGAKSKARRVSRNETSAKQKHTNRKRKRA